MLRKLGPAFLVIIGSLISGAASAGPLTFYTNEAAWLAAVSGFNVGPYPYDVTSTDNLITVQLKPDGTCCIVTNPHTTITSDGFTSFRARFSSIAIDDGLPLTLSRDVSLSFPTPIYGFATTSSIDEFDEIYLNEQLLPFNPPGFYGGFFGVVGLTSTLDFQLFGTGRSFEEDENNSVFFNDIVVATIDEPSAFASLAAGLLLLTLTMRPYSARRASRAIPASASRGSDLPKAWRVLSSRWRTLGCYEVARTD
jgi:hypothetical protein